MGGVKGMLQLEVRTGDEEKEGGEGRVGSEIR